MFFFFLAYLLLLSNGASAVPTQNLTALRSEFAPAWVSEPTSRGTWNLLYSCLFTLTLCVWSAIHLNIPPQGERQRTQLLRKVKWVLIAIFAPEVALFTAGQQLYQARVLCKELNAIVSRTTIGTCQQKLSGSTEGSPGASEIVCY